MPEIQATRTAASRLTPSDLPRKGRASLRRYWVDFALLSISAAFMGAFWLQYTEFERTSRSYAPLAELASGSASVKRVGSDAFETASPGTLFYDLDAIWVPPGGNAILNIDDEQALLSERTFVVLRRPFKGTGVAKDKIRSLSGKVITRSRFDVTSELLPKSAFQELPDKSRINKTEKKLTDTAFYPVQSSVLFFMPGAPLELPIHWPESGQAFLVVATASGRTLAKYYPAQGRDSITLPVQPGEEYVWQLLSSDSKIVLGPFSFETRGFDKAAVDAMIKAEKRHVEIMMESSPAPAVHH